MNRKIHLHATTSPEMANLRLDQALAKLFTDYSRSQLQQWIRQGWVKVDQNIVTQPKEKIQPEQEIIIEAELISQTELPAQAINLDIVHADNDLIVINKPPGLVVHPGAGNPDQTLLNALLHFDPTLKELPRAGIIHRLDKDTTGLLVIARNLVVHNALTQAMQERAIQREYAAIVQGVMVAGGTVDEPIGRDPHHRTRMAVVQNGKPAITHYRVLERFQAHTYVKVILETGRTHQIRVHLAHIQYPLVGDTTYNPHKIFAKQLSEKLRNQLQYFPRQALHAKKLSLLHPRTQKLLSWEAPLPTDMQNLLDCLRIEYQNGDST